MKIQLRNVAIAVIEILIIAGLVYQLSGGAQYLERQFLDKALANRHLDAITRSADASFGSNFASYISFLRSIIPENADVVIPPVAGSQYFLNDQNLMQYFLFPRNIVTCQADCTKWLTASDTFILAQDNFPPAKSVPSTKRLVPFTDKLGLYIPGK